jgi:hypothetical protein
MNAEQRTLAYNIRNALASDYRSLEGYYVSTTDDGIKLESRDGTSKVYHLSLTKARMKPKKSNRDR